MSERKVSCFFCKHYYDCNVRKAVRAVEDALDEASNYLNEYFLEDVLDKLNRVYDAVAEKCRDFEYESPAKKYSDIFNDIKETVENAMHVLVPFLTLRAVKEVFEKIEEQGEKQGEGGNALLHKEAGDSEKQEMQIQG